jgi:hypothetical protein
MNKIGIALGTVLILIAAVLSVTNFRLYKTLGWSDLSQEPAVITPEARFAYVILDMEAEQDLKRL